MTKGILGFASWKGGRWGHWCWTDRNLLQKKGHKRTCLNSASELTEDFVRYPVKAPKFKISGLQSRAQLQPHHENYNGKLGNQVIVRCTAFSWIVHRFPSLQHPLNIKCSACSLRVGSEVESTMGMGQKHGILVNSQFKPSADRLPQGGSHPEKVPVRSVWTHSPMTKLRSSAVRNPGDLCFIL